MAPVKRKADAKEVGPKKRQEQAPPAKRQRKDEATSESKRDQPKSVAASTLLKDEGRAFPRGGGGALSQLEHRQIQVQATKDALFEEAGHRAPKSDNLSDDEEMGETEPSHDLKKPKKKRKAKKHTAVTDEEKKEARVKVEGLKAKHLRPGCTVLGQISKISAQDVVLDLPNNLTGTVPITAISAQVNEKVQQLVNASDEEDNNDADIDLHKIFYTGQYLRAATVDNGDDPHAKLRKRIELTLDPRKTNGKLGATSMAVYSMVQASVQSVEDHGLVMDLGIEDKSVKGFMSSKEIPQELQYSNIIPGTVFLCMVTGLSSNGKVIKLSANHAKLGDTRKANVLTEASTVDPLLPGTAVEVLVSRVEGTLFSGLVLGSINAGADAVHSGAALTGVDLEKKYPVGSKVKARIIFAISDDETTKIGVSVLEHILHLNLKETGDKSKLVSPLEILQRSAIVDEAKIINIVPSLGAFTDIGLRGVPGFIHISRLSDGRVDSLEPTIGAYKLSSKHKVRVLDYNALDGIFLLTAQQSVINQPFLRYDDIKAGELVNAKVEKVLAKGGIVLELAAGLSGFVVEDHISDVKLSDPSRKYKPGASVRARVLSVDAEQRKVNLTLKKSFLDPEIPVWISYSNVEIGTSSTGIVIKVLDSGAVVRFFGALKGFLPKSEMGDTYVDNPVFRFPIGSTIKVKAVDVVANQKRLILSARSMTDADIETAQAYASLGIGALVSGVITAKTEDDLTVDLKGSNVRATLRKGHLTDGSAAKNASAFKKLRLGQAMNDLVLIEKHEKRQAMSVSNKPKLVQLALSKTLPTALADLVVGEDVCCYVRQVTQTGAFVQLAGGIVGLLPITQVPDEQRRVANLGLEKDTTVIARVVHVDKDQNRFALSLKPDNDAARPADVTSTQQSTLTKPVDEKSTTLEDYKPGYITKARVTSVKDTQLNVELADGLQGRIDVSESFVSIEDIKDRKRPLKSFQSKQVIDVRVMGIHDARNHRFLPISHRSGKVSIFELSAKLNPKDSVAIPDDLHVGQQYLGFVNNVADSALWVHLSPNVRGRVQLLDISDNPGVLQNLEKSFPLGSAVSVFVKNVDAANGRLDFSIRELSHDNVKLDDLRPDMSLAGRVTKTTDRSVIVQLSPTLSGQIALTDMADDYEKADPSSFQKNQVLRVHVVSVDKPNKRVNLTIRPSKVLSSSLPVKDKMITKASDIQIGDIVRGFIKNIADAGLFITLGHNVTGYVRVSNLSDKFLKDWKSQFEVDRLVRGKVFDVNNTNGNVQMTLKESVLSGDYKAPSGWKDFKKGQVITGKIRKVEDFGAFIVIDDSTNVSGLCHRSQVADREIDNVKDILSQGDMVKAKIMTIDADKKRVSFGLKPSYFTDEASESEEEDSDDEEGVALQDGDDSDADGGLDEGEDIDAPSSGEEEEDDEGSDGGIEIDLKDLQTLAEKSSANGNRTSKQGIDDDEEGLDAGGFNWDEDTEMADISAEADASTIAEPRKKKHKTQIKVDETGNLDANGPQSKDDFERLLLSERDNSELWLRYMGFHLDLGEVQQARDLGERALRTIHIREQDEKYNIWVALLNLESAYGSPDSLEEIFKRACQYTDVDKMHDALAGIHIQNNDYKEAEKLYEAMAGKKSFRARPEFWESYATFLLDKLKEPQRARALLERALKSIQARDALPLTKSFALLEFKRETGNPERGRTIFEGLFDTYPKKFDLWNILIDVEKNEIVKGRGAKENVSQLYERLAAPAKTKGMKPSTAKTIFKHWLSWEEKHGKNKDADKVKAKAAEFVASRQGTAAE